MVIKAISGISFTSYSGSNSYVSPNSKSRHSGGSVMAKVPMVILLAATPAVSSEAVLPAGMYFPHSPQTEQVVQTPKQADIVVRDTIRHRNEICRFTQYNNDSIHNDAEFLGFNYRVKRQDGSIGTLTGVFQAICPEKTSDNKYLVTYDPVLADPKVRAIKTCYIPEEFGEYILGFASSQQNNDAIDVFDKSLFESAFGKEEIEKSPDIRLAVERIILPKQILE